MRQGLPIKMRVGLGIRGSHLGFFVNVLSMFASKAQSKEFSTI